ncbi:hypothetical protein EU245_12105 [Lentibacillus lipolyticus]|nr:hypothetical protein EU245_12105 [Lentibacillus lipolyticus]
MNEKVKDKIGMALFAVFIIGVLVGIYFLGIVGVFEILGVQYESIWSLIIFAVSFFILGFVIDLFFGTMGKLSAENVTGSINKFVIQFLFSFVTNWITILSVDAFMESVTLTLKTKLIVAILIALLETVFSDKEETNKAKDY